MGLMRAGRFDLKTFQDVVMGVSPGPSALELILQIQDMLSLGELSSARSKRRLDFLFHEFVATAHPSGDVLEAISALNDFLFKTKYFECVDDGDAKAEDYFPGRTIESLRGAQHSLGLLYRELIQRLQMVDAQFINFPGACLVKVLYKNQLLFLDPGEQGRLLSVADLQRRLSRRYGKNTFLTGSYLETPSEVQMATRFLVKLKSIYFHERQWNLLMGVLDLLLALNPGRIGEYKERGLLLYQLGLLEEARDDLRYFISKSHPSVETAEIRRLVKEISGPHITPVV